MRVLTWNVNGFSSTLQYYPWTENKSYKFLLDALESDIICLQEVKCQRSKLPKDMAMVPGYNAYFSFSKLKLGYSGVVVYVKDTLVSQPRRAYEGVTGILDADNDGFEYNLETPAEQLDAEGRCIILDFGIFILFNTYFPNDSEGIRTEFKMDYHQCVEQRMKRFLSQGRQVLLVGDINAVHEEIDHCDPRQSMKENDITDFKDLPHRRWLDNIIDPKGPFIDMTRLYHPDRKNMFTCWNTRKNARPANFGTRIDYILASKGLKPWFKYSDIHPDIMGSDHCPVYADFLDEIVNSYQDKETLITDLSPILSCNYPEFSSKQKKLSNYFMKSPASASMSLVSSTPPVSYTPSVSYTPMPSLSSTSNKRSLDDMRSTGTKKPKQKSIQSFFSGKKIEEEEIDVDKLISKAQEKQVSAKEWTSIFSAPEIPRCKVHNEPCLERTVTKKGPNLGRVFYICSKPIGPKDGPAHQLNCNYFQWKTTAK